MKNQYIQTGVYQNIDEIDELITPKTALLLVFYGAEVDDFSLFYRLKKKNIPFIGCMDVGRLVDDYYSMDTKKLAGMSISKEVIHQVEVVSYDMRKSQSYESILSGSKPAYQNALRRMGINTDNPDMEKEFAINLLYGLQSASPALAGQQESSVFLQTVGGSSGGKLDFKYSSVISNKGMGAIGATAIIQLQPGFRLLTDLVTSFDKVEGQLTVTDLANPRQITTLNGNPAAAEYAKAVGIGHDQLKPETFATYTLGVETAEGERFITSIMKDDGQGGLLTYNDVNEGSTFSIFKSLNQAQTRKKHISSLDKDKLIGYFSFDCVLCYLARNENKEIKEVATMYGDVLPDVPKIGFGTFSENLCGANVNQTETFLAISKV